MPVENGMGLSDATPIKQMHFCELLKTHVCATKAIFTKNKDWLHPCYYFFDITAGSGYSVSGDKGSPLLFGNIAHQLKLQFKAVCIEREKKNATQLKKYLAKHPSFTVVHGNHEDVLPGHYIQSGSKWQFGLLYVDPNGIFNIGSLYSFFKHRAHSKIDVLINCNATAIKRARKSPACHEDLTLYQRIAVIPKKHWIVREPYGPHQWSFLIGTNWDAFPKFEHLGFYKVESVRGQEIFDRLNFTAEERNGI